MFSCAKRSLHLIFSAQIYFQLKTIFCPAIFRLKKLHPLKNSANNSLQFLSFFSQNPLSTQQFFFQKKTTTNISLRASSTPLVQLKSFLPLRITLFRAPLV